MPFVTNSIGRKLHQSEAVFGRETVQEVLLLTGRVDEPKPCELWMISTISDDKCGNNPPNLMSVANPSRKSASWTETENLSYYIPCLSKASETPPHCLFFF